MGRSLGLDVHRDFCEVAVADGGRARSTGRVATTTEDLQMLAASPAADDRVLLEATGNALAIACLIEPYVDEVVLANARQHKKLVATAHDSGSHFDDGLRLVRRVQTDHDALGGIADGGVHTVNLARGKRCVSRCHCDSSEVELLELVGYPRNIADILLC